MRGKEKYRGWGFESVQLLKLNSTVEIEYFIRSLLTKGWLGICGNLIWNGCMYSNLSEFSTNRYLLTDVEGETLIGESWEMTRYWTFFSVDQIVWGTK